jgi:hypothetical protein
MHLAKAPPPLGIAQAAIGRDRKADTARSQVIGDLDQLACSQRVAIGAAEHDFLGPGAKIVGEVLLEIIQ